MLQNRGYPDLEIIETYWNVNGAILKDFLNRNPEIIETYWNVNFPPSS